MQGASATQFNLPAQSRQSFSPRQGSPSRWTGSLDQDVSGRNDRGYIAITHLPKFLQKTAGLTDMGIAFVVQFIRHELLAHMSFNVLEMMTTGGICFPF
jgi:hypothetical protein